MEFIGAGAAASLARAATYFEQLSSQGSSPDELRVNLREDITAARAELEATLTGHDSFDALAFIRMLAGPWDLTGVHESETQVETSQAVQDVIAHAALGLGLPRQPLTGENSGQPDVGALIAAASKVVMAARTLAMLDGSQLSHPLGPLAGEFMAYELSVRGRQYTSIAEELNTELLGHAHVSPMLEQVLGFTLGHIREVRVASLALLNERFFGARDRVGDAVQSGAGVGGIDRDQFRHDINLMMNECRLYGAVSSADVAQRIGLDVGVVGAVLRFFSTSRPEADAKNPIEAFVDGEALSHGSIGDGDEFLLLNGFLAEDELRRDVERGLKAASDGARGRANVWAKYDKNRSAFSERMSADAFSSLLADEVPRWQAKKYAGPVDVADVGSLSQESDHPHIAMRIYESDALFVVDGVAICIEVKAGSVTDKARGGRANRLAKDLEKTLQEGNDQAQRLVQLIEANRGVWGDDGQWVDLSDVTEVHSVIVMLDDMGPLSLSMNELADKGIIETEDVPWIVSLHDLLVISRTSDHPAQFLEYLRRRRGRRLATMVNGADELDMFMWFVGGGMYFEPDPVEVTAQLPLDRPITAGQMRRFDRQRRVRLGTLTDPLDSWFYGREGHSSIEAPKPRVLDRERDSQESGLAEVRG